jgi:hypothetical protein
MKTPYDNHGRSDALGSTQPRHRLVCLSVSKGRMLGSDERRHGISDRNRLRSRLCSSSPGGGMALDGAFSSAARGRSSTRSAPPSIARPGPTTARSGSPLRTGLIFCRFTSDRFLSSASERRSSPASPILPARRTSPRSPISYPRGTGNPRRSPQSPRSSLIGSAPYVALQLKAVAPTVLMVVNSFDRAHLTPGTPSTSFYLAVSLLLALFAIAFGARRITPKEHQDGLILAIAVESAPPVPRRGGRESRRTRYSHCGLALSRLSGADQSVRCPARNCGTEGFSKGVNQS